MSEKLSVYESRTEEDYRYCIETVCSIPTLCVEAARYAAEQQKANPKFICRDAQQLPCDKTTEAYHMGAYVGFRIVRSLEALNGEEPNHFRDLRTESNLCIARDGLVERFRRHGSDFSFCKYGHTVITQENADELYEYLKVNLPQVDVVYQPTIMAAALDVVGRYEAAREYRAQHSINARFYNIMRKERIDKLFDRVLSEPPENR